MTVSPSRGTVSKNVLLLHLPLLCGMPWPTVTLQWPRTGKARGTGVICVATLSLLRHNDFFLCLPSSYTLHPPSLSTSLILSPIVPICPHHADHSLPHQWYLLLSCISYLSLSQFMRDWSFCIPSLLSSPQKFHHTTDIKHDISVLS